MIILEGLSVMSNSIPSLLIVDDNENNLYATKQVLNSFDINIHTVLSGEQALRSIFIHEYFLILMDVNMPEMDGFETVSLIKGNHEFAHIPIIFLTAIRSEERFVDAGYENGAVDYLVKPVDPVILKSKIKVFIDLKLAQIKLEHLASFDTLTGLVNRRMFHSEQERTLSLAKRHNNHFAVLFLDVDYFKEINDTLGHDAGDYLLRLIAEYIKENLRESDVVARMGGDEFAILITDIKKPDDAGAVARHILERIEKPMMLNGTQIQTGASIGIAYYPTCGQTCEELNKAADLALYKAKKQRHNFCFYSKLMQTQMQERLALVQGLRNVIKNNELEVYYQIKVDAQTKKIMGTEALLRWNHPEKGIISPNDFIPVAEETGSIIHLGHWVLHEAAAQCAKWNHDPSRNSPIIVAINVSALQLKSLGFVNTLKDMLEKYDMQPNWVELELTETAVMEDAEMAMTILSSIRALGVKIAIDDFGTGYSSLSYLQKLSVDTLKIDMSFIQAIGSDTDSNKIVEAIIKLAHTLDIEVVAEGVETKAQLDFLTKHGCNCIQGYYFGKPVPVNELELNLNLKDS